MSGAAAGDTGTLRAPAAPPTLGVEVRQDLELRPDDAAAFEAMLESRPSTGVFVSRAWLSGFFAEPPMGFEPGLVLLRQAGALRAAVPIAVRRTMTRVHVGLLGGGLGSDRVDLVAARGYESLAADAFVAWMRDAFGDKALILELRDVPAESPLWGAVHRAGIERTLRHALHPREIHTLPYLDLHDGLPGIDAAPPAVNARSLAKHRRWLDRRCRLRIDLLREPPDIAHAFEALVRFLHARWRDPIESSVLDRPRARRFHERVLPRLAAENRLRMLRVSADGRTVAVFYGLATANWWGYYLAGYDREWAGRIRLGQITLAAAIDEATRAGAAEFDFLKGAERVKYFWAVRERATLDADLYSDRSGAQLRRATRATRDAAAAFAKSACNFLSINGYGAHPTVR